MTKFDKFLRKTAHLIPYVLVLGIIVGIGIIIYDFITLTDNTLAYTMIPFVFITFLFLVLYYVSRHIFDKRLGYLNIEFYYIAVIFAFLAMYLGSFLNFYERFEWWDNVLHFGSGVILGFLGLSIINLFFGKSVDEKADLFIILIFGVMTAQSIGVFWEFYEYSFDHLVDGNMQRTINIGNPANLDLLSQYVSPAGYFRDPGLKDTMGDLLLATLGSALAAVFYYPKLRKENSHIIVKNKKIDENDIKYVAIDLDGTLLNSEHQISSFNEKILKSIQEKGIKVILCSGRSTHNMRDYARQIDLYKNEGYIVSYNGAKVFTLNSDGSENLIDEVAFTNHQTEVLNKLVGNYGRNYVLYSDGFVHARDIKDISEVYKDNKEIIIDDQLTGDNRIKALIMDEPENIINCFDEVSEKVLDKYHTFNVFTSGASLIEITPPDAAKGTGLNKLFEHIGAERKNLLCFGDQNNDLSMFKYAKYSVSMANATTQLKKISTHNTFTNDRDGVGRFLENKVFKKL